MADRLTLVEAIKTGRIDDFVRQEEARGIGPASEREVRRLLKMAATIKLPKSKGRTSRSASRGGSSGK